VVQFPSLNANSTQLNVRGSVGTRTVEGGIKNKLDMEINNENLVEQKMKRGGPGEAGTTP